MFPQKLKELIKHPLSIVAVCLVIIYFLTAMLIDFFYGGGIGFAPSTGYNETLTVQLSNSATIVNVSSTNDDDGNALALSASNKGYFMIDPGQTDAESIVCTGISGNTLTGCIRGLSSSGSDETGSPDLASTHDVGSRIIMTNIAQFFGNYLNIWDDQSVAGDKTFSATTTITGKLIVPTALSTADDNAASIEYVNNVAQQGAATSTETSAGISELATALEQASSTDLGGDRPLVLQAKYASDNTRGFSLVKSQTASTSDQTATTTTTYLAQTFKTTATTTRITRLSLNLKKTAIPTGTTTVALYSVSNDVPDTSLGIMGTVSSSTLTTSYVFYDFDDLNINVSSNKTYVIVLSATGVDNTNYVEWAYSNSNVYSDGNYLISYNSGSAWTASSTADFAFKVYGNDPTTSNTVIVSGSDGKLDKSWLDLTENYSFSGDLTGANINITSTTTTAGVITDEIITDEIITDEIITDEIVANTGTTTITGNLEVTGDYDFAGASYSGIKWEHISNGILSANNNAGQASDTSNIPSGTKAMILKVASYSLEAGNYDDVTYGDLTLIPNVITSGKINSNEDVPSVFEGVSFSISGSVLSGETIGFSFGGGRSAHVGATVYYFK